MSVLAEKDNTKFQSAVKIVDGKLIMSLPDAQNPVVWQMDLEQAQSAAFTVEEDKKNKSFAFSLKKSSGDIEVIASYQDKNDAVAVLMETSTILQNAQGKIRQSAVLQHTATENAPAQNQNKRGALITFLMVLMLIFVWYIIARSGDLNNAQGSQSVSQAAGDVNPGNSSGVAVSAEDFLNNR